MMEKEIKEKIEKHIKYLNEAKEKINKLAKAAQKQKHQVLSDVYGYGFITIMHIIDEFENTFINCINSNNEVSEKKEKSCL